MQSLSQVPIGVGDPEAQARFIAENRDFLLEHPALNALLEKVVLRTLEAPSQEELDRLRDLPDTEPTVVALEDKLMADRVVFGLGRVIVDDFGEIITLSGNGRGIGAYKILRGMYERLVTAAYVAVEPSEARSFIEDGIIKKWRLWQSALEFSPELKDRVPKEKVQTMEEDYKAVKTKRAASYCKKCGQPKTQDAWTRVDLLSMAKQVDANLAVLYGSCYLEPTFHSHATSFGLDVRFRRTEEGATSYRETSESEARLAILLAHNLILRFLTLHNGYFKLGLDDEIQKRTDAFQEIWDRSADTPEAK